MTQFFLAILGLVVFAWSWSKMGGIMEEWKDKGKK